MVAGMDELFLIDRDARRPALSGQERLAVPSASGAERPSTVWLLPIHLTDVVMPEHR
jgi:hypothetical protein